MALCLALRINCSLSSLDLDLVPPEEQVGAVSVTVVRSDCLVSVFRTVALLHGGDGWTSFGVE